MRLAFFVKSSLAKWVSFHTAVEISENSTLFASKVVATNREKYFSRDIHFHANLLSYFQESSRLIQI